MLPTRDGIGLATDVYRLEGASPAPVLVTRTPYDKEQTVVGGSGVAFDIFRAVQAGYAVVIQDVRGRFASEGEFTPHFQEVRDGADTIDWLAGQPWSSGAVGDSAAHTWAAPSGRSRASSRRPYGQWHRRSLLRTCTRAWRFRAVHTSFTADVGQP
jgi:hypothetical protein